MESGECDTNWARLNSNQKSPSSQPNPGLHILLTFEPERNVKNEFFFLSSASILNPDREQSDFCWQHIAMEHLRTEVV
jgi:hypothetical protein